MGAIDALLLGIVQGVTEFLPISSDGHLALAQAGLGLTPSLPLSVLLHAGTLLVVLVAFRREVLAMLRGAIGIALSPRAGVRTPEGRLALNVLAASIPTAGIGLALQDASSAWTASPRIVAAFLATTAVLLALSFRRGGSRPIDVGRAVVIGVAQGLAVLPGLSRSGATIAVALLLGIPREEAARFSFAASIPAVVGALVLEVRHVRFGAVGVAPAVLGVVAAALAGAIALWALLGAVRTGRLWMFAAYLVPLAAVVWLVA